MDGEISNYINIWISAIACLVYCYFISFNIPKGKLRLLSLIPIFYILTVLPLKLTTACLGGTTTFFLTWLANFKLLLFSLGQGPLCTSPSVSLFHFISIACFPVVIKNKPPPSPQIPSKDSKSPLVFAIKVLLFVLLTPVYEHKQHIHPKIVSVGYCCYMYLGLELFLTIVGALARTLVGVELEPQFNEPYLSTSLQDFWGRRWNLIVTNTLRPTVYQPVKLMCTKILGKKWATVLAVLSTFLVSGLMHEIVYYYLGRVRPTWEVTCFFVLQGVFLVTENHLKMVLKDRLRLHPVVSGACTIGILMVTSSWLFFPQLLRCNADVRVYGELMALVDYFKNLGKQIWLSFSEIFV